MGIACSWSSCIDGSPRSSGPSRSSGPRLSYVGIGPASVGIGVGNPSLSEVGRWFPSVLRAVTIIRPETLVRWHRAGFRRYWRWKSGSLGGRPKIAADLRALIRRISAENPLWGAPRIHGELLKLGFEVAQ